jgi:hypothetical protein
MNTEDKMEMLRWLSGRNAHMTPSELAFLLDLPLGETDEGGERESRTPMQ